MAWFYCWNRSRSRIFTNFTDFSIHCLFMSIHTVSRCWTIISRVTFDQESTDQHRLALVLGSDRIRTRNWRSGDPLFRWYSNDRLELDGQDDWKWTEDFSKIFKKVYLLKIVDYWTIRKCLIPSSWRCWAA